MADAEIVIVAENFGDLLRRSDQRGGIAVGARELGYLCPETFIDPGALLRQRKQSTRAGSRMTIGWFAIAGFVLHSRRLVKDSFGLCPGLFLGVGKDGTDRQTKAGGRSAMLCGGGPNPRRHIAHLRIGFPPERKCIGMLAGNLDSRVGCAAHQELNSLTANRL